MTEVMKRIGLVFASGAAKQKRKRPGCFLWSVFESYWDAKMHLVYRFFASLHYCYIARFQPWKSKPWSLVLDLFLEEGVFNTGDGMKQDM